MLASFLKKFTPAQDKEPYSLRCYRMSISDRRST
jgi:hypothetical protein